MCHMHVLKNLFNLLFLLVSIESQLLIVFVICDHKVGDILEPIFSETVVKCTTDKGGYSRLSEKRRNLFPTNFFFERWWWRLFSFEVLIDLFPKFLHLISTLIDRWHKGWNNFHKVFKKWNGIIKGNKDLNVRFKFLLLLEKVIKIYCRR